MANANNAAQDEQFINDFGQYIDYYQNVIRELEDADPPAVPDELSKLAGALQYLLVKRGCSINYDLINDRGWMVSLRYVLAPKKYTFLKQEFCVLLAEDPELYYIVLEFNEKSFVVFGCDNNTIPWTDESRNNNITRLTIISEHLLCHYFSRASPGRVLPNIPPYVKLFLNYNVLVPVEGGANVQRNELYQRFVTKMGLVNPGLNAIIRLFRVVIFILRENGCLIDLPNDSPHIINYTGGIIPMLYKTKNYFVCLIPVLNFCLLSLRDEERNLISASKIPLIKVPEFGVVPATIEFDNHRFNALNTYLGSILLQLENQREDILSPELRR